MPRGARWCLAPSNPLRAPRREAEAITGLTPRPQRQDRCPEDCSLPAPGRSSTGLREGTTEPPRRMDTEMDVARGLLAVQASSMLPSRPALPVGRTGCRCSTEAARTCRQHARRSPARSGTRSAKPSIPRRPIVGAPTRSCGHGAAPAPLTSCLGAAADHERGAAACIACHRLDDRPRSAVRLELSACRITAPPRRCF